MTLEEDFFDNNDVMAIFYSKNPGVARTTNTAREYGSVQAQTPSVRFVVHLLWASVSCTTDPRQIEPVEFEPKPRSYHTNRNESNSAQCPVHFRSIRTVRCERHFTVFTQSDVRQLYGSPCVQLRIWESAPYVYKRCILDSSPWVRISVRLHNLTRKQCYRKDDRAMHRLNSTGRYGRRCWTNMFFPPFWISKKWIFKRKLWSGGSICVSVQILVEIS